MLTKCKDHKGVFSVLEWAHLWEQIVANSHVVCFVFECKLLHLFSLFNSHVDKWIPRLLLVFLFLCFHAFQCVPILFCSQLSPLKLSRFRNKSFIGNWSPLVTYDCNGFGWVTGFRLFFRWDQFSFFVQNFALLSNFYIKKIVTNPMNFWKQIIWSRFLKKKL